MHFDINELKGRLDFLEVLLNNTNDKYKRREILNDIKKIKYLIRYMNSSIILYSDDGCDRVLGDFKEKKDSVVASRVLDFFNSYTDQMQSSLVCFYNKTKLPWKVRKDFRISNVKYYELIDDFFKTFNHELFELYKYLIEEKRIEISSKMYEGEKYARGLCFCIGNLREAYVLSRFNNKMSTGSTLPHELGHAYLLHKANFNNEPNIFIEAYSIFIEFIFGDYLKNTRYSGVAYSSEYQRLDSFLGMIDYEFANLSRLKDMYFTFPFYYYSDGSLARIDSAKMILSDMLGMYFVSLYRFDKKKYNIMMPAFLDMYGKVTDEEILKYFKLSNLVDGSIDTLDTYVKTYRR